MTRFDRRSMRPMVLFMLCGVVSMFPLELPGCNRQAPTPTTRPTTRTSSANPRPVTDPELIALNNRGVGLMGKFEYEQARVIFHELVNAKRDWMDARINLAIATLNRQREGDDQAALDMLNEALRDDPQNLRAHYCTGLLKLFLQSPDEALPHFQKVAEADRDDAYAAYYVGQCLAQSHKYAEALPWYQKAIDHDAYLRSAYYASSQALHALGRDDQARNMLEVFQQLDKNARAHLAEFKYTRMGKKGESLAVNLGSPKVAAKPDGPAFLDAVPLIETSGKYPWRNRDSGDRSNSITACDINGDGLVDVFISNALNGTDGRFNAVCMNKGDGHFELDLDNPLAAVPDVNAALWGDVDNDGLIDVFLCRHGPNQLWRQTEKNKWSDVTALAGVDNGHLNTIDGALFDADGDGDLDIFCVNADGPNELFNNNLNGTFRPIAKDQGITGNGKGSRQVLPVDVDGDRDLDIIVLNNEPPNDIWINDRGWKYQQAQNFDALRNADFDSIVAEHTDDGRVLLYTVAEGRSISWYQLTSDGTWQTRGILDPQPDTKRRPGSLLSMADIEGAGRLSLLRSEWNGWKVSTNSSLTPKPWSSILGGWSVVNLDVGRGPSVVGMADGGPPIIWRPGPGRFPFAALSFTGRTQGESMRSNASGIGTQYAARIDSRWVVGDTFRSSSAPGQSSQPVAIGLGGQPQIDFVMVDWTDGVFQTEIDLKSGELHTIAETQRQLSSCPVIFAWNGTKFDFVADLLGVGGIGYATGPNEYAPSRPWEHLLLPPNSLSEKNGRFLLKIGEPMEEACYLDAARLVSYDLPPGWKMTVDDRMSINPPDATGEPRFYRNEVRPSRAVNDRGDDVTESIVTADLKAAPVGEIDPRFIGRLMSDHVLTLTFDHSLDDSVRSGRPALIADGWIEYPYSQTMFAAWQAGAEYRAPTIEARGNDGQWHVVLNQFGYPAGMPRQMSVPLANLPPGTTQLRITTNMEIYWDRLSVAYIEDCPSCVSHQATLVSSRLSAPGFAHRTTGPERQPYYDYDHRIPLWDTRHQTGFYTAFGPVDDLIAKKDDALAIFGPGEEVQMEFDAASLPPPADGWTRRFVLELDGWCKDMDLYTKDGETIEPLPSSGTSSNPLRDELHRRYNTRFESGR